MKKYCLFFVVLILIGSCTDIIEFPRPPHNPELVLFATMDQHQTSVFVTETTGQQDSNLPDRVVNAEVKIEASDGTILQLPNMQNGNYFANFLAKDGEQYSLTVEKQGFEKIKSTVIFPPPINILSLDVQFLDSIELDIDRTRYFYQFDIQLEEQNDEIEYYEVNSFFSARLLVDSVFTDSSKIPDILPIQNANTIELDNEGEFYVSNVDSNMISFRGAFDLTSGEYLKKVQIEVKSSNAENYEHATSLFNLRLYDDGDLFTVNPIELYSNVENGQGFFAAVQIDTISKRIPR